MKKLFLIFLFLINSFIGFTQSGKQIDPAKDPRNFSNGFVMLSKNKALCVWSFDLSRYNVLDTARIVVTYRKTTYPNDDVQPSEPEKMQLYIGKHTTYFFNKDRILLDSIYTANKFDPNKQALSQFGFSSIYRLQSEKLIQEIIRIPFAHNQAFFYREPEPAFEWQLGIADTTICGYRCMDATTSFRGKIWKVWFSPELPYAVGPWKLAGVPGLILKAEDCSGIHSYEMINIQQSIRIIPLYKWKMKEMAHDKWLEYEQKMHKNPYLFVDHNTLYISLEQIGDDRFLNESNWKNIPYYPLELE